MEMDKKAMVDSLMDSFLAANVKQADVVSMFGHPIFGTRSPNQGDASMHPEANPATAPWKGFAQSGNRLAVPLGSNTYMTDPVGSSLLSQSQTSGIPAAPIHRSTNSFLDYVNPWGETENYEMGDKPMLEGSDLVDAGLFGAGGALLGGRLGHKAENSKALNALAGAYGRSADDVRSHLGDDAFNSALRQIRGGYISSDQPTEVNTAAANNSMLGEYARFSRRPVSVLGGLMDSARGLANDQYVPGGTEAIRSIDFGPFHLPNDAIAPANVGKGGRGGQPSVAGTPFNPDRRSLSNDLGAALTLQAGALGNKGHLPINITNKDTKTDRQGDQGVFRSQAAANMSPLYRKVLGLPGMNMTNKGIMADMASKERAQVHLPLGEAPHNQPYWQSKGFSPSHAARWGAAAGLGYLGERAASNLLFPNTQYVPAQVPGKIYGAPIASPPVPPTGAR